MKKQLVIIPLIALVWVLCVVNAGCSPKDKNMSQSGDTTIVNTTLLTTAVIGYQSTTPLEVCIVNHKILAVRALPNEETPRFFDRVRGELLHRWDGLSVDEALKLPVDAVSGATYSSNAVITNMRTALEYYKQAKH